MVKNGIALVAAAVATWNGLILDVDAFATPATGLVQRSASSNTPSQLLSTATAETSAVDSDNIPTNLPSECGMDYIPLATMLATEDLAGADQVCFNVQSVQERPILGSRFLTQFNLSFCLLFFLVHSRCINRDIWSQREGP